jgi:uncharacterized protein
VTVRRISRKNESNSCTKAPLPLSALATVVVIVVLRSTLNCANIVALPVLQGVGAAFNAYFIMNRREGHSSVLRSATARAILSSALTTAGAFGALALSAHPGTPAGVGFC